MVMSFGLSMVNRYNSQKGVRYVNKRLLDLYLTKVLLQAAQTLFGYYIFE